MASWQSSQQPASRRLFNLWLPTSCLRDDATPDACLSSLVSRYSNKRETKRTTRNDTSSNTTPRHTLPSLIESPTSSFTLNCNDYKTNKKGIKDRGIREKEAERKKDQMICRTLLITYTRESSPETLRSARLRGYIRITKLKPGEQKSLQNLWRRTATVSQSTPKTKNQSCLLCYIPLGERRRRRKDFGNKK